MTAVNGRRGAGRAGRAVVALVALAAAGLVAGLPGCSDDGSGPDARELLGIWGAVSYEYTSDADPAQTYDLIDEGGSYTLELVVGGTYGWTLNTLQGATTGHGSFTVSAGRLTLTPDGGGASTVYSLAFNEVFLTLRNTDAAWDFDGDGAGESAELVLVLDRF